MPKVVKLTGEDGLWLFHCPGCGHDHWFNDAENDHNRPVWKWNGDVDKPTVTPSVLVNNHTPEQRCHLFIKEGRIQFLNDCHHTLRGRTVDMEEYED